MPNLTTESTPPAVAPDAAVQRAKSYAEIEDARRAAADAHDLEQRRLIAAADAKRAAERRAWWSGVLCYVAGGALVGIAMGIWSAKKR